MRINITEFGNICLSFVVRRFGENREQKLQNLM
jgi:hypothetical protein